MSNAPMNPPLPPIVLQAADSEKTLTIERGTNHRGDFIRITEAVRGRHNIVVLPLSSLSDLIAALSRLHA